MSVGKAAYMRVVLEKNTPSIDSDGLRVNNWQAVKTLWCWRSTLATTYARKGNQLVEGRIESFKIRNQNINATDYRLVAGDDIYDIRGVRTDTEDRHRIYVDCELSNDTTQ